MLVYTVFLVIFVSSWQSSAATERNLVCYYPAESSLRDGNAAITVTEIEVALQFCTHLVYGYVGLKADTFQVVSLNENLDIHRRNFATITALKERNPQIKFLLSLGGDRDLENPEKYMQLLEASRERQNLFIVSAHNMVRNYGFDGFDLAFQFPRNKPRKVHSDVGKTWKGFKKLFTGDFIVDEQAEEHKRQFTSLVGDLKQTLQAENFLLSLTVLPNVNSSWYFDVPALERKVDFVNLAAFDFLTPQRNPEEADYTAPLYELHDQDRLGHYNVNFQVEHWILQRFPANKINLGIPTYGRSWIMNTDSGTTGMPVVAATGGAGPSGPKSKSEGFLNWAEVCAKLPNPGNVKGKFADAPLRRVADPTKRYGSYAYRAADENGQFGLWVSYEDPDTAAYKAAYAKVKNLGGVALFDLSHDDFHGQCTGDKFPMLRATKYRLL